MRASGPAYTCENEAARAPSSALRAPPAQREKGKPSGAAPPNTRVAIAGLVLVRQRPGTAKGVIFMTLEDETGVANVIVWPKVFERERAKVLGGRFISVTGKLQNEAGVIHVIAERVEDLTPMLGLLSADGATLSALASADEIKRPGDREKQARGAPDLFSQAPPAAPVAPARISPAQISPANDDAVRREAHAVAGAMPKGRNFH